MLIFKINCEKMTWIECFKLAYCFYMAHPKREWEEDCLSCPLGNSLDFSLSFAWHQLSSLASLAIRNVCPVRRSWLLSSIFTNFNQDLTFVSPLLSPLSFDIRHKPFSNAERRTKLRWRLKDNSNKKDAPFFSCQCLGKAKGKTLSWILLTSVEWFKRMRID